MKIEGLDNLQRKLNDLQRRAQNLNGIVKFSGVAENDQKWS